MPENASSSSSAARSASRIRDHLANERTFLAWVRTALGLIGLGFVLARMGLFLRQLALTGLTTQQRGLKAGREFLVTGVVFLLLGTGLCAWTFRLYEQTIRRIEEDHYMPARGTARALTALVVGGGLIIVGLVLWRTVVQE